jgi:uncharacterized protein YjiK
MPFPRPLRLRRLALVSLALLFAVGVAFHNHLPQRLYYAASTARAAPDWAGRSVWLPHYRSIAPAVTVEAVQDNLSGLAYDPSRAGSGR